MKVPTCKLKEVISKFQHNYKHIYIYIPIYLSPYRKTQELFKFIRKNKVILLRSYFLINLKINL